MIYFEQYIHTTDVNNYDHVIKFGWLKKNEMSVQSNTQLQWWENAWLRITQQYILLYRYRFVDSICLFISFVCVLRVDSSLIAHSSRTKLREATPSINKALATAASSLPW